MIDGTDPDISVFADSGGKLLIWYGMRTPACPCTAPRNTSIPSNQQLGAHKVKGFARMLTSPSIGHNLDGPGTDPLSIDLLAAMDAWVEKGVAPDKLVATRFAPASTTAVAKRPVCEFPQFPRYNSSGDPTRQRACLLCDLSHC